jgi:hypothetical protein
MAKKKATDTFWSSTLNFSDVVDLSVAGAAALTEELNDAVQRICEEYGVA